MHSHSVWLRALGLGALLLATALPLAHAQRDAPSAADEREILATYTLPNIHLASLQNERLPAHPIANDRGLFLGGVGSDLWHGPTDPPDEFWMVTDRGPNDEVHDKRVFPVPDFTPLILHVRA